MQERWLRQVRPSLESVFRGRLRGVLLYGSEARGESRAESDLDLLILLEGPVRLGADLETAVRALYPLQLEVDRPIHALPVFYDSYQAGEYGLYREARREGVLL